MCARRNESSELPLGDQDRLLLYVERTKRLKQATLLAGGAMPAIKLNIKAERDAGVVSELHIPASDPMVALVALERPFLLESEDISFTRIANIMSKSTKEKFPDLFSRIAIARAAFLSIGPGPEEIKCVFEGNQLTHSYSLDLYLNGRVFHSDPEKVAQVQRIEKNGFIRGYFEMMAASAIMGYVAPIMMLGKIIEEFFLIAEESGEN